MGVAVGLLLLALDRRGTMSGRDEQVAIRDTLRSLNMRSMVVHGCEVGLVAHVGPRRGEHVRKLWRVDSTVRSLLDGIGKPLGDDGSHLSCSHGGGFHHVRCEGSITKGVGDLSRFLCESDTSGVVEVHVGECGRDAGVRVRVAVS